MIQIPLMLEIALSLFLIGLGGGAFFWGASQIHRYGGRNEQN